MFHLLHLCFERDIWDSEQTEESLGVLKGFNEMLLQYGEALEYFRYVFFFEILKLIRKAVKYYFCCCGSHDTVSSYLVAIFHNSQCSYKAIHCV